MKKTFAVFAIVLLIAAAALASITLSAGAVQTHQQGGVTQETDDTASVYEASNRFNAQTIDVRIAYGQIVNSKFAPGPRSQGVSVLIDIGTCKYQSSDGVFSGNIPGAICTSLNTKAKAYQDGLENLVISAGIAPGTQVAN